MLWIDFVTIVLSIAAMTFFSVVYCTVYCPGCEVYKLLVLVVRFITLKCTLITNESLRRCLCFYVFRKISLKLIFPNVWEDKVRVYFSECWENKVSLPPKKKKNMNKKVFSNTMKLK